MLRTRNRSMGREIRAIPAMSSGRRSPFTPRPDTNRDAVIGPSRVRRGPGDRARAPVFGPPYFFKAASMAAFAAAMTGVGSSLFASIWAVMALLNASLILLKPGMKLHGLA